MERVFLCFLKFHVFLIHGVATVSLVLAIFCFQDFWFPSAYGTPLHISLWLLLPSSGRIKCQLTFCPCDASLFKVQCHNTLFIFPIIVSLFPAHLVIVTSSIQRGVLAEIAFEMLSCLVT